MRVYFLYGSSPTGTSKSLDTSLSHKLELHLQWPADVLLEDDGVLHRSSLLCLEILCHRKYTELEAPDSRSPSQAALETLRPPNHAVFGFLWRNIVSANIYTKLYFTRKAHLCPPCLLPGYHLETEYSKRDISCTHTQFYFETAAQFPASFTSLYHVTHTHVPDSRQYSSWNFNILQIQRTFRIDSTVGSCYISLFSF